MSSKNVEKNKRNILKSGNLQYRQYTRVLEEEVSCKKCAWQGKVKELDTDQHDTYFAKDCPECSATVLLVSYPKDDDYKSDLWPDK